MITRQVLKTLVSLDFYEPCAMLDFIAYSSLCDVYKHELTGCGQCIIFHHDSEDLMSIMIIWRLHENPPHALWPIKQ